nr:hypothetical protein [Tanacetum cinerariifolium]
VSLSVSLSTTDPSSLTALGGRKDPGLLNITSYANCEAFKEVVEETQCFFWKPPYVMDVEDVQEWVVCVKPKALDVQSMIFKEDRTVGMVLEEDPSSFWGVTENTIEKKILFSEEAGIFSGGIFSARLLIAFTALVCLDVYCGGLFFNMGNNQAV